MLCNSSSSLTSSLFARSFLTKTEYFFLPCKLINLRTTQNYVQMFGICTCAHTHTWINACLWAWFKSMGSVPQTKCLGKSRHKKIYYCSVVCENFWENYHTYINAADIHMHVLTISIIVNRSKSAIRINNVHNCKMLTTEHCSL
jgi:hypothetical protein